MIELDEIRHLAGTCDEDMRRRLLRYVELRQYFVELTGDEALHEATPILHMIVEDNPARVEILATAKQLRALGRTTFAAL